MAIDKAVDSAQLDSGLTDIADAIREKGGTSATLAFPAGFVSAIGSIPSGSGIDASTASHVVNGKWQRPSAWPNVESLFNRLSQSYEGIWLTYDNANGIPTVAGFHAATTAGQYVVERGHIANGAFVVDTTTALNSGKTFYENYASCGYDYPIYHIYPVSGHITSFAYDYVLEEVSGINVVPLYAQRCIEQTGKLPYISSIKTLGTRYLERDGLIRASEVVITSLNSAWKDQISLQELDLTGWNTRNWAVTTLYRCWSGCYSLYTLDLSQWDTSSWAVTTLEQAFYNCSSLKSVNFTGVDTENWSVTSLSSMFSNCRSLEELPGFSDIDTSGWNVTTMLDAFSRCYSLKTIDIKDWDVSGWNMINIGSLFSDCVCLETVDLSGWDTSNWSSVNMSYFIANCLSLKTLDLSGWNVLPSSLQNFSSAPSRLEIVKLSGVDYSGNVNQGTIPSGMFLREIWPPIIHQSHTYQEDIALSHDSLLRILNALPIESGKILTLSTLKSRLTTAEIQIATDKGWTVA